MRTSTTLTLLAAMALGLAACAGDPDAPRRGPGGREEGARERPSVFISPAGQPFRAEPGQPYPVVVWFAQADANHDGKLTREEFRADFGAFFKVVDANHDGVIDGFETADYEHAIAPEILSILERPAQRGPYPSSQTAGGSGGGGHRRGGGGPGGGQSAASGARSDMLLRLQGAAAYSLLNISEPVAGADEDFDGKITVKEFLDAADRRFDMLDAQQLGYLTLAGLPRTPQQITIDGRKPGAK
jgi:hypothetical protein